MMLEAESLDVKSCIIGALGNEITGILPEVSQRAKHRDSSIKSLPLYFLLSLLASVQIRESFFISDFKIA